MKAKRSIAAGAALLLVGSLAPVLAAPPQRDAERGVRRSLIRLNQLVSARDKAIVGEFADGPDTTLISSQTAEIARGVTEIAAYVERLYAQPQTISWAWRRVEVSVRGGASWLVAEGEIVFRGDEGDRREPYRLTGVLELHAGRWLWRLFHGSTPAA